VAALEEPPTLSDGESHEADPGAKEGSVAGGRPRSCSVVVLFSEPALEEAVAAAEGG
jgi:hypothetical protein